MLTTVTGGEIAVTTPRSRHCPIGAVLYFTAKHGLPRASNVPSRSGIAPAADRADRFNDRLCRTAAELRSVILKARAVALKNAKHERAAAAFKNRLLAELDRDRAVRRAARDEVPAAIYMPAQQLAA